jgi:branched-chain amino acid transport system substrate-binding protein
MDFNKMYEGKFGPGSRSLFGASAWDVLLLLQRVMPEVLKEAKPGTVEFRTALRDKMERVKDMVATQGVYNLTPQDHCGADERGQVLVEIKNGKWVYVPE